MVLVLMRDRHPRLADEVGSVGGVRLLIFTALAAVFFLTFLPTPFLASPPPSPPDGRGRRGPCASGDPGAPDPLHRLGMGVAVDVVPPRRDHGDPRPYRVEECLRCSRSAAVVRHEQSLRGNILGVRQGERPLPFHVSWRAGRGAGAHQDGHAPIVHSPRERARGMAHTEFAPRPARGESALHEHDRRPACPCHLGRFSGQGLSRPARAEPELSHLELAQHRRDAAGVVVVAVREHGLPRRTPIRASAGATTRSPASKDPRPRPPASTSTAPPSGPRTRTDRPCPTSRTCTSAGPGPGGGGPRCRATQPSAAARAHAARGTEPGALRHASQAVPARGTSRARGGRGTWSAPHGTTAAARAPVSVASAHAWASLPAACPAIGTSARSRARPPVAMMAAQAGPPRGSPGGPRAPVVRGARPVRVRSRGGGGRRGPERQRGDAGDREDGGRGARPREKPARGRLSWNPGSSNRAGRSTTRQAAARASVLSPSPVRPSARPATRGSPPQPPEPPGLRAHDRHQADDDDACDPQVHQAAPTAEPERPQRKQTGAEEDGHVQAADREHVKVPDSRCTQRLRREEPRSPGAWRPRGRARPPPRAHGPGGARGGRCSRPRVGRVRAGRAPRGRRRGALTVPVRSMPRARSLRGRGLPPPGFPSGTGRRRRHQVWMRSPRRSASRCAAAPGGAPSGTPHAQHRGAGRCASVTRTCVEEDHARAVGFLSVRAARGPRPLTPAPGPAGSRRSFARAFGGASAEASPSPASAAAISRSARAHRPPARAGVAASRARTTSQTGRGSQGAPSPMLAPASRAREGASAGRLAGCTATAPEEAGTQGILSGRAEAGRTRRRPSRSALARGREHLLAHPGPEGSSAQSTCELTCATCASPARSGGR